jgi:hypothetical protein
MIIKKIILSALLLSFILIPFAGCSKEKENTNTNSPVNEQAADEPSEGVAEETVPQYELEIFDWNQRAFNILVNYNPESVWGDLDFTAEEITGDPINDAVYMRNALIAV